MMKLTARSVATRHSVTVFGNDGMLYLGKLLKEQGRKGFKTFLLADSNTERHCIPVFLEKMAGLAPDHILVFKAGEESKSVETAATIWNELTQHQADRHSLLINLGGGVVTDLGGFAASCFKRGIRFIHLPTTLMGMADAAIGGKTAVNVGTLKNQAGTFCLPEAVVVDPRFLATLDRKHVMSGIAEIAKSALVADIRFWHRLKAKGLKEIAAIPADDPFWLRTIAEAAEIKHRIVRLDFEEKKERKLLNFGHTFAHAFESLMLRKGTPVSHGEAVAMGMICEAWLSVRIFGLAESSFTEISAWLSEGFVIYPPGDTGIADLEALMLHDKKNIAGKIRFTGILAPGQGRINGEVTGAQIREALQFYSEQSGV